jgi:hypothetical protein
VTFDQIHVPEGADEALEWAATREFEMRCRRAERQRLGIAAVFKKTAEAVKEFNRVFAGDPTVPSGLRTTDVP